MRSPWSGLICVAAVLAATTVAAFSQSIQLLDSDQRGLTIEVRTAFPRVAAHESQPGRVTVFIPGALYPDLAGLPERPYIRVFIAVPEGMRPVMSRVTSETMPISEEGLPSVAHAYFGIEEIEGWKAPPPVELPRGLSPRRVAELAATGWMREVQIAEVHFNVVRSRGRGGGVIYHPRIEATIDFVPDPDPAHRKPRRCRSGHDPENAYSRLQRTLLVNGHDIVRPYSEDEQDFGEGSGNFFESSGAEGAGMTAPVKISVDADGLYAITPADLTAAGVDPNMVNPQDFRGELMGTSIPVEVRGEGDASFDPGDAIVFFGRAVTGPQTRRNVYWLHFDGSSPRAATIDGTFGAPAATPASFVTTSHAEGDLIYTQNAPPAAIDNWWWALQIASDPSSEDLFYLVPTPNLDPAAHTVNVRVNLQGRTAIGGVNPDHHTQIFLGLTMIDDQTWDGQASFEHSVAVSSSLLNSGNTAVRVLMVGDTGAIVDHVYSNFIEIDYQRTYQATSLMTTRPLPGSTSRPGRSPAPAPMPSNSRTRWPPRKNMPRRQT